MKTQRIHDYFYLNESYKQNPKEYFKEIARMLENDWGEAESKLKLLDVGCETGSF